MNTKQRRARDPRRRRSSRSVKPKPQKDPFQFQDLHDTPKGVVLTEKPGTTTVVIPNRHLVFGLIASLLPIGMVAFLFTQLDTEKGLPVSFIVFVLTLSLVLAGFALFHIFGYTRLQIRGKQFEHFRGLFGIGTTRIMPLSSIRSLGTKRKNVAMRANFGIAGMNNISDGQAGNVYLFIDGEHYIESCKGAKAKDVYYAKYFVSHFVKEVRKGQKAPAAPARA